jgi:hypothetical protein
MDSYCSQPISAWSGPARSRTSPPSAANSSPPGQRVGKKDAHRQARQCG